VVSGSPVSAGKAPATVAVDPGGKFVFTGNKTSYDVSMFTLNATSGALTAIVPGPTRARKSPASLVVTAGTTDITYTPTFVYVADLGGGVPTLSVKASTGALTTVTGSPFGSGGPQRSPFRPTANFFMRRTTGRMTSANTASTLPPAR
jgi:DNA-binding beta-propeller fold protein YncE